MNKFLDKISRWLAHHQLSLNVWKIVFMTFGLYVDRVPTEIEIVMIGTRVKRVEYIKYLRI